MAFRILVELLASCQLVSVHTSDLSSCHRALHPKTAVCVCQHASKGDHAAAASVCVVFIAKRLKTSDIPPGEMFR